MCAAKKVDPYKVWRLAKNAMWHFKDEKMGKPNLVRKAMEKTFKGKYKKGMNRRANNQAFTLNPTHNLKHIQCELKGK